MKDVIFFGNLEYKTKSTVNKCNNFLFSLFLVISEMRKVSTYLAPYVSIVIVTQAGKAGIED
jgi:hypothetical protein